MKITQWIYFGLAFIVPAILATNFTLNHFYVNGGLVYDSGWFAYLSTHSAQWPMLNPPLLGGSYFSIHASFIFYLYSALYETLSWLGVSLPAPMFFSLTQGFWFGLVPVSAYCLFLSPLTKRNVCNLRLAFGYALLVMLNGVYLSIILLPHFEIAIPALLFAFFALWGNGYKKLCYLPLIVGLIVREDVGLHFFGVFILITLSLFYFSKKYNNKKNTIFFFRLSILCLCYSLIIIVLQHLLFPSNSLSRVYLGSPIFHHVTWAFTKERLCTLIVYRPYIFAPLIVSAILAYRQKDIFQSLGFFFVLPWVILSFFAIVSLAGTLALYYAFPILIAMLWPAVVYTLSKEMTISTRSFISYWRNACVISGLSALLFSPYLFGYPHDRHFIRSLGFEWITHWENNQKILKVIYSSSALKLNNIAVDNAVASLVIDKLSSMNFVNRITDITSTSTQNINAMIFLPNAVDNDLTQQMIQLLNLSDTCKLKNTPYMVARKAGIHYSGLC